MIITGNLKTCRESQGYAVALRAISHKLNGGVGLSSGLARLTRTAVRGSGAKELGAT